MMFSKKVSKSKENENELICMQFMTKICALAGLFPGNSNTNINKIYVIVLTTASIVGWIYSVYIKNNFMLTGCNVFIKITDQISCGLLCLATVTFSLTSTFVYPGKFFNAIQSLKRFDYLINISSPRTVSMGLAIFIFGNAVLLFPMVLDTLAWINRYDLNTYKCYFIRNFQYYQLGVITFLWLWFALEIRKRFVLFNKFLIKMIPTPSILLRNDAHHHGLFKMANIPQIRDEIKHKTALYNGLCDIVDLINDVFGAGLLIYVIFTISYVLLYSIILIEYTVFDSKTRIDNYIIITSIVWIIGDFVKMMVVALAGETLSSESFKTVRICYGIINSLENGPNQYYDGIKQELNFLIQQATHRKPCLTASGFFVANSTMMGFIIGSITSYVIVAVQFLNEMSN
uniref:Gustatory receptor n=1 Tax=Pyrrhalta aenescens TaxID=281545 RepID=A0A1J0KKT4_9CUCU|nr:gustatory receptor 14 [Pyrrhalta aenescens]